MTTTLLPSNAGVFHQHTALHVAIWTAKSDNDFEHVLTMLLDAKACVDGQQTNNSISPLQTAIHAGRADAVRLLLANGANPRLHNAPGHGAFIAEQRGLVSEIVLAPTCP